MNLLVIRFSSLGDVVLASSVFDSLSRHFSVDFLTFKPYGEIFYNDPRISKVIEVERKSLRNFKNLIDFSKTLKKYDLIVDLQVNLRSILITKLAKVKTVRYEKNSVRRRLVLYFKGLKRKQLFVPKMYCTAVEKILKRAENCFPKIFLDEQEVKRIKNKLNLGKFAVIVPGAKWKEKIYPYFGEVAKLFKNKGLEVVVLGGKEDEEVCKSVESVCGGINLCGKLSLRESASVMKLASVVVSNDSAGVHLARAVSTPVVAIFGPTHPVFGFAPSPEEGVAITLDLDCSPCSLHGKTKCKHRKCLEIPPELVVEKALEVARK